MSFQDFGSRSSASRPSMMTTTTTSTTAQATSQHQPPSCYAAHTTLGQASLNQISESLLQYQRNVGILEKIVHSLTAGSSKSSSRGPVFNREELELQYQAQVDVISQLGEKVHKLISDLTKKNESNPSIKTTLIKLERDFDRVQKQADSLTRAVTRMKQSEASAAASGQASQQSQQANTNGTAYEEYQQQMQMQLQEDRLAEQIMREREDEIRQINRGMYQVNEIYKDLAHIVASQQEQVDAIETQMEDSRANAEAGLTQIEKANDKYGSSNCVIS